MYNKISALDPIGEHTKQQLLSYFYNELKNTSTNDNRGSFNFINSIDNEAVRLVVPIIDNVLGVNNWRLSRAIFFNTVLGFYIHVDRYSTNFKSNKPWQAFIFPLDIVLEDSLYEADLKLLILEQKWHGDKNASFSRTSNTVNTSSINKAINVVSDYSQLENYKEGFVDPLLLQWTKFSPDDIAGLSVSHVLDWKPGIPLTFPMDRLHCSSEVKNNYIKSKIGFTVFTEMT